MYVGTYRDHGMYEGCGITLPFQQAVDMLLPFCLPILKQLVEQFINRYGIIVMIKLLQYLDSSLSD